MRPYSPRLTFFLLGIANGVQCHGRATALKTLYSFNSTSNLVSSVRPPMLMPTCRLLIAKDLETPAQFISIEMRLTVRIKFFLRRWIWGVGPYLSDFVLLL